MAICEHPQHLHLFDSVLMGASVQHRVVFLRFLYVVVLICCIYMLMCCCEMSHIAIRCHLLLLGKSYASVQCMLCFLSLLLYFWTIRGNILVYIELQKVHKYGCKM